MDDFNICQTCLISDVKMFQLSQHGLAHKMEFVTGLKILDDWIPTQLCYQCAAIIRKFYLFKQNSILANNCLKENLNKMKRDELNYERHNLKIDSTLGVSETYSLDIDPNFVSPAKLEIPAEDEPADDAIIDTGFQNEPDRDDEMKEDLGAVVKTEEVDPETNQNRDDFYILSVDQGEQDPYEVPLKRLKLEQDSERVTRSSSRGKKKVKSGKSSKEDRQNYVKRRTMRKILRDLDVKKDLTKKRQTKQKVAMAKPKKMPYDHGRSDCSQFATEFMLSRDAQLRELNERCNSLNYMHSQFKCLYCFKGFLEQSTYSNHMLRHDESQGEHVCDICRYRYKTRRRLRCHMMQHQRRLKCNKCSYVSSTPSQAMTHHKWHEGVKYDCPHCNMSFSIRSTVMNHIREKHPSNHVCAQCGETFQSPHGLSMHRQRMHIAPMRAQRASEASGSNAGAGDERPCEECEVTFATAAAYDRHLVTSSNHAIKKKKKKTIYRPPYKPPKPADAIIGPVTCGICGKGYKTHERYEYHVRRHHVDGGVEPTRKQSKAPAVSFMCDICGRCVTAKNTLINHIRTHTGEKPFKCDKCGKPFRTKQQHDNHIILRHTSEQRHECPTCKRRFNCAANMTRHTAVHSELRPYACELCGKTFKTSNSMICHRNNVHLKKKYNKRDDSDSINAAVAVGSNEGFKMAADVGSVHNVNRQGAHEYKIAAELSNYFRMKADFE